MIPNEMNTVDEIIEQEKMSLDEMVSRTPPGWMIVSEEHYKSLVASRDEYREKLHKKQVELRYRASIMVDIASMLAGCGSYEHRTKNEVILRAIDTLLQYRNAETMFTANGDSDDIPY